MSVTPSKVNQALPPLSLYVHIPWCVKKCPYCDFNSHAAPQALPEKDYLKKLEQDLLADLALIEKRPLQSIFFGGGTPSLFSGAGIATILNFAEQHVGFATNIEITLEANPGTTEQQKFADFRAAGVNRLSMGIQSFNDQHLKQLGRIHSSDEAKRAINQAQQVGFDNLNLDFMHGLPDQSCAQALEDLQTAIAFQPKHLSWYQLTIEPNTEFYKHPPALPNEDSRWQIFTDGQALLKQAGFEQYEVSAYSQAGKASHHNLNYWRFGDYLGIGAGAHGKLSHWQNNQLNITRTRKTRLPKDYLNPDSQCCIKQSVSTDELPSEFLMNVLRLNEGFSKTDFESVTGLPSHHIKQGIEEAKQRGLLTENSDQRLTPTEQGRLFLDDLVALFI